MIKGRGAPSAKQIVRELEDKGAVCLPSFFDALFVEEMRTEAAILLSGHIDGANIIESHASGRMVWVHPKVFSEPRFARSGQALGLLFFREIAARYDQNCEFFCNSIIAHDYEPCKITDTHFDMNRSLKFMIYLSDVDKESAAFRYCLGSHRQNRKLRSCYLLMGGSIEEIPNVPGPTENIVLTDMEGPRGTLVIFDSDGFHTAGRLKEGREQLLIRSRTVLSGWLNNRVFRYVAKRNPLKLFVPLVVPEGRQATRGSTRAT